MHLTSAHIRHSLNHRDSVLKRIVRPMELNYSVFGRIPHSDTSAEPSPMTHAGGTGFPELRYSDAPQTSSANIKVHEKVAFERTQVNLRFCHLRAGFTHMRCSGLTSGSLPREELFSLGRTTMSQAGSACKWFALFAHLQDLTFP